MVGTGAIRQYWTQGAQNGQRDVKVTCELVSANESAGFAKWHANVFPPQRRDMRKEFDRISRLALFLAKTASPSFSVFQ